MLAELNPKDSKKLANLIFEIQNSCPWPILKKDSLSDIENKILNSKALSQNSLLAFVDHLSIYLQSFQELKNTNAYDPIGHLKSYLKNLNWHSDSQLETLIKSEDVIEIYDHQGLQVYRCFNFFKYSSYSFTDIITNHWWDLYQRNPFIGKSLGDLAVKIFTQNIVDPILLDLPVHHTTEIWSSKKGVANLRHKNLIPLKDLNGRTIAIIAPIQVLDFQFTQLSSDDFASEFSSSL